MVELVATEHDNPIHTIVQNRYKGMTVDEADTNEIGKLVDNKVQKDGIRQDH